MDKKYLTGLFIKSPHQNAPDFVLGQISIKREDLIKELQGMSDEWINLDVKKSKEGEVYGQINTYQKQNSNGTSKGGLTPEESERIRQAREGNDGYPDDIDPSNIPFN